MTDKNVENNDVQVMVGEGVIAFILMFLVSPSLISAKDTGLMLLGIILIGIIFAFFLDKFPVKSKLKAWVFGLASK